MKIGLYHFNVVLKRFNQLDSSGILVLHWSLLRQWTVFKKKGLTISYHPYERNLKQTPLQNWNGVVSVEETWRTYTYTGSALRS